MNKETDNFRCVACDLKLATKEDVKIHLLEKHGIDANIIQGIQQQESHMDGRGPHGTRFYINKSRWVYSNLAADCKDIHIEEEVIGFLRDMNIQSEQLNTSSSVLSNGSKESSASFLKSDKAPADSTPGTGIKQTAIHFNPFYILGATTRDNRRRIFELAEEKSLTIDAQTCIKARTDLTNPRNRLAAEIAWLPGLSPRRAQELLSALRQDIRSLMAYTNLPYLAEANLVAAAFELLDPEMEFLDPEMRAIDFSDCIQSFALTVHRIKSDDVMKEINEDRAVAGFPEVADRDAIETALSERRRYYIRAIRESLNSLSPIQIAEVLTYVVGISTDEGESHAPLLIDDLIDSYEVDTQSYLKKEVDNIKKLIDGTRAAAPRGTQAVKPLIDRLDEVIHKWDKVVDPIHISLKARGIDHDMSQELAREVRSLGIDLFNKYDMIEMAARITKILQEVFDELPEIMLRLQEDSESIENIIINRRDTSQRKKEWEKEITYEADLGILFKDKLRISPKGVQWNDRVFALETITRVRWGGIRHSINGIPSGTTYTIAFGDNFKETVVNIKKLEVYSTFIDKLWRAVCVRLLTQYLEELKTGKRLFFGDAAVDDWGVNLTKHKFLASENVYYKWGETHIWNADGSFFIGAKNDKKTFVGLSYIEIPNAHILESIVSMSFKKWKGRLSGLIEDDE